MNAGRQRGFTLIELMIALVVSSLLVGMILSIFSRMSLAYRGQQQIAGVQQVLAAARATIEADAKQAGFGVAQGFKIAASGPTVLQWPVQIRDSSTGPDQIAFFYADSSAQAVVAGVLPTWAATATVTTAAVPTGFAVNDVVVFSKVDTSVTTPIPGGAGIEANIATYDACVGQISGISGLNVTISKMAPWGNASSTQCGTGGPAVGASMYKFVAHGYRIDTSTPARSALGALQQSLTGGMFNSDTQDGWADVAYGFTDIQTALQVYDGDAVDTPDLDVDPAREWYSGAAQNDQTGTSVALTAPAPAPLEMSISLVARTDRNIEGITTSATPNLSAPPNLDNNTVGNRISVSLPSATDPALQGSRIYRYLTFQVDFRNMGVGR